MAEKVILLMPSEGMSAVKACEKVGLPWGTFSRFVVEHEEFAGRYACARTALLERMSHELQDIADTPLIGTTTTIKADGGIEVKEGDMIEHRRLQIDARKWLLSKLMPKQFGDKQQIEHSGAVDIATTLLAARKRSGIDRP